MSEREHALNPKKCWCCAGRLHQNTPTPVTREELEELEALEAEVKRLADAVLELATGLKTEMRLRQALERRLGRLRKALGAAGESISAHCSSPSDAQHIAWECKQLAAALAEDDKPACPERSRREEAGGKVLCDRDVEAEPCCMDVAKVQVLLGGVKPGETLHVLVTRRPEGAPDG